MAAERYKAKHTEALVGLGIRFVDGTARPQGRNPGRSPHEEWLKSKDYEEDGENE